jgi:hypothetical protein
MWSAWFGWDRRATEEIRDGHRVFEPGPFGGWQVIGSFGAMAVLSAAVYLLLRLSPLGKTTAHRVAALMLLTCAAPVGLSVPASRAYASWDETAQSVFGVYVAAFVGLLLLGCVLVGVEMVVGKHDRKWHQDL